jgi:DNA-binding transcriptional LysR family regulator
MEANQAHRYKELRLGQLRAFCECVRHGSFSAAARALGMSQPAVWQQVRALEREFGASLLRRQGRAWAPSEDGQVLLELASSIVGTVDALKEVFDQRRRQAPQVLRLIATPEILAEELAGPVATFAGAHPAVRIGLASYTGPGSLECLTTGEADLAALPLALDLGGGRRLLAEQPFASRDWTLVLPQGHPLAGKQRPRPADLARQPLVLPAAGSAWRQRVDELFRAPGVLEGLNVVLEVDVALAARRCVALGRGVAICPLPESAVPLPGLEMRSLGHLLAPEPVVLLSRRGGTPRPPARLFIEHLRGQVAS